MEKIHLIGWALLLCLLTASAITMVVSSEAEAREKLGSKINLEPGKCEVLTIQKQVSNATEIDSNPYEIEFIVWFTKDGVLDRVIGTVAITNPTEAAIKAAVEPECETLWNKTQAEYGTIDTVIIKPDTVDIQSVLSQAYDYVKRVWTNKTTEGVP